MTPSKTPKTASIASLKRKILRLESGIRYLEAERDLYEMMSHDLASEPLIEAIKFKFPAIAKQWEEYRA